VLEGLRLVLGRDLRVIECVLDLRLELRRRDLAVERVGEARLVGDGEERGVIITDVAVEGARLVEAGELRSDGREAREVSVLGFRNARRKERHQRGDREGRRRAKKAVGQVSLSLSELRKNTSRASGEATVFHANRPT